MRIARSISELSHEQGSLGFVPTMGALHEGHLSLMRAARNANQRVTASIFVNPTQFGPNEDFANYPRQLERDLDLLTTAGVDELFLPSDDEMVGATGVSVSVGPLASKWEGAIRPGHFDGVATVVAKLFNIVQPTRAYFGRKDLQQCQVIDTLIRCFKYPIELVIEDTIREPDGLAMSSRNAYLSEAERRLAPRLFGELSRASGRIQSGANVAQELLTSRAELTTAGFSVDYFALVSLPDMDEVPHPTQSCSLVTAAKLGSTRLIDNLPVQAG